MVIQGVFSNHLHLEPAGLNGAVESDPSRRGKAVCDLLQIYISTVYAPFQE